MYVVVVCYYIIKCLDFWMYRHVTYAYSLPLINFYKFWYHVVYLCPAFKELPCDVSMSYPCLVYVLVWCPLSRSPSLLLHTPPTLLSLQIHTHTHKIPVAKIDCPQNKYLKLQHPNHFKTFLNYEWSRTNDSNKRQKGRYHCEVTLNKIILKNGYEH